jgi:lipopolysaccharide biosynthesis glycosyltransferase
MQGLLIHLTELRGLLRRHRRQEARGLAHAWVDDPACEPVGRLAAAVVAHAEGFSELAAALFLRVPEDLALMHAPVERVACLAFDGTPPAMAICASASDAMMSDLACADAGDLLALARAALELGVPGISLQLCSVLLGEQRYQDQAIAARDLRVMALACERRLCASYPPVASSITRVAVVDWAEPGAPTHKRDVDLLALVSGLACGLTLRYRGVNELALDLVALATSRTSTSDLPSVDCDVLDPLVDPGEPWLDATWVLVPSVRLDANFARAAALLSRSDRSIVFSIEVADVRVLAPNVVQWLRRCAPVGCRDWATVLVLREFGVPAFFAGGVVAGALPVSLPGSSSADRNSHNSAHSRIDCALQRCTRVLHADSQSAVPDEEYADGLACGFVAQKFSPKGEVRQAFEGLLDITSPALVTLHSRAQSRLDALLDALASGDPGTAVWPAWRDACEADLKRADEFCAVYADLPAIQLDIDAALAAVRGSNPPNAARSQPRIEVALAVDANLFAQLPVVLESAISNCSAPVRIHLLARGIAPDELLHLKREFGGLAELVVHDFTPVRYGGALRMLPHTTVSTMDRLLLPELLRDIDKIIYLDIDLVVLGDLADLWAVDLAGRRLASKSSSSPGARYVLQMVNHAIAGLPAQQAFDVRRRLFAEGPLCCRAFNAGVLVLNLARMREESFALRHIPMIESWAMNDQDVLNIYARDQRIELDPRWNAIPRQDLTDGAWIVHFAGPVKPWSKLYISRARDFHAYAARYRERVASLGRE